MITRVSRTIKIAVIEMAIIASVNVAPGFYHKGRGKDLGGAFEIKSQFELWYLLKQFSFFCV